MTEVRLRAIIIDDEETGIVALKVLVEKYIPELKVVAECHGSSGAIELIENYKPEIVFLDISMPDMDGFQLLEKLSWKNFSLVFTTAHQEYGLKALKANAFDYLLKPIYHRELRQTIDKIIQRQAEREGLLESLDFSLLSKLNPGKLNKLGITTKDGIEFIDPAEIVTMESQANYTVISLDTGVELVTFKRLGMFETMLCHDQVNFMRVHHSFIVNLQKVVRYMKDAEDIIMSNQQRVPLSKSRKQTFLTWLQ